MNNLILFQFVVLAACAGSKTRSTLLVPKTPIPITQQLDSLAEIGIIQPRLFEDFEDSTFLDNGKCSGNCPEIVGQGNNKFMRAQLSGLMKVGHRSEVSFGKQCKLSQDSLYVLYFKVRFRPDSAGTFPKSMFAQIHAAKTKAQKEDRNLRSWQSFVGRVEAGGTNGYWESEKVAEKRKLSRFQLPHETWEEVVVLLKLSDDEDGSIKAYRNGVLEFEANGPNSAAWMTTQFLKLGVYSAHNSGKKAKYGEPSMAFRTTDFDDVRVYSVRGVGEIDGLIEF